MNKQNCDTECNRCPHTGCQSNVHNKPMLRLQGRSVIRPDIYGKNPGVQSVVYGSPKLTQPIYIQSYDHAFEKCTFSVGHVWEYKDGKFHLIDSQVINDDKQGTYLSEEDQRLMKEFWEHASSRLSKTPRKAE